MIVVWPSAIPVARLILKSKQDWLGCTRFATGMAGGALTGTFIRLSVMGGAPDNLVQQSTRILFECYAPSDTEAEGLARRAAGLLTSVRGEYVGTAWVYRVDLTSGVTEYYDGTRQLYRYQFEAAIRLRGEEATS